jgi:hypothetical protein
MLPQVIVYGGLTCSEGKLAIDLSFDAIRFDRVLLNDLEIASSLISRAQPAVPGRRDDQHAGS